MNTSERVAAYKAELAQNKPLEKFSLMAFIFNSFYFLYYNCFGWFALFVVLPLLIMLPFLSAGLAFSGFLIGLVASRVIAGFAAPSVVRKHQQTYAQKFAKADSDAQAEYFSVSRLQMTILLLLSGGLYAFYWAYKNWKAVKDTTKGDVWPVLWGWFLWIFYIIPLFKKMKADMLKAGLQTSGFMALGYGFVITVLLQGTCFSDVWAQVLPQWVSIIYLFGLLAFLLGIGLLVAAQNQINLYNQKVQRKSTVRKGMLLGEVLVTVFGLLLIIAGFFGEDTARPASVSKLNSLSDKEQEAVGFMLVSYYRHTILYNEFCTEQGRPLQNFEQAYVQEFEPQYDIMQQKLLSIGTSFNQAAADVYPLILQTKENMMQSVAQEMEEARRLSGRDMPMSELCAILDEEAANVLSQNSGLKAALDASAAALLPNS